MKKLGVLEFLRGLNEEQRSLLGFGSVLILLLALMFFAFIPLVEEALLVRDRVVKLSDGLEAYEELAHREHYAQFAQEQKIKLATLEKRLPKNLRQSDLMEELYTAADGCGVKLTAMKSGRKESSQNQELPLEIECTGSYEEVLKFLSYVEKEGGFKKIREFTARGDEDNGSLAVSMVLCAYKN